MAQAQVRFYASLNAFLPLPARQQATTCDFNGPVSIKHIIESLGVPHTEVALILANGKCVDFRYPVRAGDRLAVFPTFSTLEPSSSSALRPPLPRPVRFVLDVHLGRLAGYLRLLGFDALYRNSYDDTELARISAAQERVLVTRDRRLLMRKEIIFGCCLLTRDSQQQLVTVLHRFKLVDAIRPWSRCLRCNGQLEPVAKETVLHRLEPLTRLHYDAFDICQECSQIYWQGSHFDSLRAFVEDIRARATGNSRADTLTWRT